MEVLSKYILLPGGIWKTEEFEKFITCLFSIFYILWIIFLQAIEHPLKIKITIYHIQQWVKLIKFFYSNKLVQYYSQQEATPDKAAALQPPTTHHENYQDITGEVGTSS